MRKHKPRLAAKTHKPANPHNSINRALILKYRQSRRWRNISTLTRAIWPICQHIDGSNQCEQVAQSVHHIMQAEEHPELFFHQSNVIPICSRHHALVSQMERRGKTAEAQALYSYWQDVVTNYNKNRL